MFYMYKKVLSAPNIILKRRELIKELNDQAQIPYLGFNKTLDYFWYEGKKLESVSLESLRRYISSYPVLDLLDLDNEQKSAASLSETYKDTIFPNSLSIEKMTDLESFMNILYKMMTALYYLSLHYKVFSCAGSYPMGCCDVASDAMLFSLLDHGVPSVMTARYYDDFNEHVFLVVPFVAKESGNGFIILDPTADQYGRQPNYIKAVWGNTIKYKYTWNNPPKQPDVIRYFNPNSSEDLIKRIDDPTEIRITLEEAFTHPLSVNLKNFE
jgi:hypothetical protein